MNTEEVAPSAREVLCVDFDSTLVEWGPLEGPFRFKPGAVDALRAFRSLGYEIVILTSRASQTWWYAHCRGTGEDPMAFGIRQHALVVAAMDSIGFTGVRVTAEKVPAFAYIDDRAVPFRDDWAEIVGMIPQAPMR